MLGRIYKIEEFDSLLSTNDKLKYLAGKQRLNTGTVIMAQEQTAGKGQRGRQWLSDKGQNLLFSLFYRPDKMRAIEQFRLTQLISISIFDTLKEHVFQTESKLSIKWPNDIYAGERKLGGVLIENAILGQDIQHSIIGVGININQKKFSDNLPNPVSLFQLSEKKYDLRAILIDILDNFETNCLKDQNTLKLTYTKCLFGLNELRGFKIKGKKVKAKIKGVEDVGTLILEYDKKRLSFDHESIDFLL